MISSARTQPAGSGRKLEAKATDFLHQRRFWDWGEEDQRNLDAWLDESIAHRIAFLRVEAGMERFDQLKTSRPSGFEQDEPREERHLLKPLMLIAASLVLVAALGFAATKYFLAEPPDRSFATDVGGRALLSFADGTRMELNTDTSVRFRITNDERTVWLNKGEVWFHVSHDPAHPFHVFMGEHSVTDLGTEFLIRRDPGRTEVALLAGRAQLGATGGQLQTTLLTPGDDAVATGASITMTRKTPEELANELAWQRGVVVFRNTRLSDAIRELNRYSRTKLVIDDPAVANMTLGGQFRTDNLDEFLSLVQVSLRLRVEQRGNDILLFRETQETKKNGRGKRDR